MLRMISCAAASAVLVSGCTSMNTMDDTKTISEITSDAPTPTTAAAYVARAMAGDQYEIQSSQIALQRSQNPAVREFAQTVIDNHTKMSEMFRTQMQKAGLPIPAIVWAPTETQMLAELRGAYGPAFDRLYVSQQTKTHAQALALHQAYSLHGDNFDVRYAAAAAVPTVQAHIRRLAEIEAQMG